MRLCILLKAKDRSGLVYKQIIVQGKYGPYQSKRLIRPGKPQTKQPDLSVSTFENDTVAFKNEESGNIVEIENKDILHYLSDKPYMEYGEIMDTIQSIVDDTDSSDEVDMMFGTFSFTDYNNRTWTTPQINQIFDWVTASNVRGIREDCKEFDNAPYKTYTPYKTTMTMPALLKTVESNKDLFTGGDLYRGVTNFPAWDKAQIGDVLPFSLGSFSESEEVAEMFTGGEFDDAGTTSAIIVLENNTDDRIQGISIPDILAEIEERGSLEAFGRDDAMEYSVNEKEWIVRSPFLQVTRIEKATEESHRKIYVSALNSNPNMDKAVQDDYSTRIWDMQKVFDLPLHRRK